MSSESKTTFDLEPNPFERSFATKESTSSNQSSISEHRDSSTSTSNDESNSSSKPSSNKHNLHIPNISSLNNQQSGKLPGINSPLFTPGGRRLPPLGLSPPPVTGNALSNPGTPGSNLWNSLLTATNNPNPLNHTHSNGMPPNNGSGPSFNQFVNTLRKTGLTPNESNLRSGLTPGSLSHFAFGTSMPGLTTPGALLNSPMTPGLSSLLGLSSNPGVSNQMSPVIRQQMATQQQERQVEVQQNQHIPESQNQVQQQIPQVQIQQAQQNIPQEQQLPQHLQHQLQQAQSNATYNTNIPELVSNSPSLPPVSAPKTIKVKSEPAAEKTSSQPAARGRKRKSESVEGTKTKKARGEGKGRKSKVKLESEERASSQPEDHSHDSQNDEKDNDGGKSDSEKRKNFLERNRVAASKCRQRKKQLVRKMEDELTFYSTGYRELSVQVNQLRDQLVNLKDILGGHKNCSILAQSVGGFEQLNNIIQQAEYITQVSGSSSSDVTSMPSTIPTTLNNANNGNANNNGVAFHMAPQNPGMATGMSIRANSNSTTSGVTPEMANHFQGSQMGSHPHSVTDLPAAAAAANAANGIASTLAGNGDLRVINSMSNLSAMNTTPQQHHPHQQQPLATNYNLRPVNSMVELQQSLHNHSKYTGGLNV
ncbi:bZIP protein that binds to CRE motifs, interacts with Mig1p [Scheffersomyces xylosifermentans]|uniref:bZIP protein that binds to CRE motifs, interacts with Mig1p n=1 Tax=Scheffersomyces xylosifermentans TaxID=1304137 RepID=UPI00315C99C7